MSAATLLATIAGVLAAAGLTALADAPLGCRRGRRRRRAPEPVARRSAVVPVLLRLGRRLGAPAAPAGLADRIAAAGAPLGLGAREVMAVKAGAALAAPLALGPAAQALPGRLPWIVLVVSPLLGFWAPDALLRRAARIRGRAMESELADVLELLRVAAGAGLPAGRALAEVGRRHPGHLGRELARAGAQVALGVPLERALRRLAARSPAAGVPELVTAVLRAQRAGTPLAPVLAAQALEARAREARRIAAEAARAGPRMQLVIALLLVPSVMLLVAAALLTSLTGEGLP